MTFCIAAVSPPDFSHGFLLAEYKPIERSDSFLAGIAGENLLVEISSAGPIAWGSDIDLR
jgi:hypothetical protein